MIYLACPYWHPDPAIRESRARVADAWAASLFPRPVFSPLTYGTAIEREFSRRPTNSQWVEFMMHFVMLADELRILHLPGWRESDGCRREIEVAEGRGIPIIHVARQEIIDAVTAPPRGASRHIAILTAWEEADQP